MSSSAFLREAASWTTRNSDIEIIKLPLSWLQPKSNGENFAIVILGVCTPRECEILIEESERVGYEPALVNVGNGKQRFIPEVRFNDRSMIDSPGKKHPIKPIS